MSAESPVASEGQPLGSGAGIGQPGCVLRNTADTITGSAFPIAGSAPISIVLPNNPALAGSALHVQVAEVDLTPIRIWTSNGLTLTIGAL